MAWIQFVMSLLCMLWLGSSLFCLSCVCVCYGLDPVCSVSHVYVMAWIQFVLSLMCMLWLGSSLFCCSCVCYGLDPVCPVSLVYVMAWIHTVGVHAYWRWGRKCTHRKNRPTQDARCLNLHQHFHARTTRWSLLLPSSLPHLVRLQVTRGYAGAGFCLRVDPPADPVVGPPWPQHFSPGLPKVAGGVPDSPTESEEFSPLLHTT